MASSDECRDHLEVVDDCLEYMAKTLEFAKDDMQTTEKVMDDKNAKLEDTKISIQANVRTVEALKRTLEAVKLSLEDDFEVVDEVENTLKTLKLTVKSTQKGDKNLEDEPNNMYATEKDTVNPSLFFMNFEKTTEDRQGSKKSTEVSEEFAFTEMYDSETQMKPDRKSGNILKTLDDKKSELENWSTEIKLETKEKLSAITTIDLKNQETEIFEEDEMELEKCVQHEEKQEISNEEIEITKEKHFLSVEERPSQDYELAQILVGLNETSGEIHFSNDEFLRPKKVSGVLEFELSEEKSGQSAEKPGLNEELTLAEEQFVQPNENSFEEFVPDKEEYAQNNEFSRLTKEFELFMDEYERAKKPELNDEFEMAKEHSLMPKEQNLKECETTTEDSMQNKDISGITKYFNFIEEKSEPSKDVTEEFKYNEKNPAHPKENNSGELEQSKEESMQIEHSSGINTECELVKEKPLVLIVQPKNKPYGSNEFELTWEKCMQPEENHPDELGMADEQFVQLTYQTDVIKEAFKLAREKSELPKETSGTAKKSKLVKEKYLQPKENKVARESKLDDGIFVRPKDKPRVSKKPDLAKAKTLGHKESDRNIGRYKDQPVITKNAFELARDKSVRPKEKRQVESEQSDKKSVRPSKESDRNFVRYKDQPVITKDAFELARDKSVLPKEKRQVESERSVKKSVRPSDQSKETKEGFKLAKDATFRPEEKRFMDKVDHVDDDSCSSETDEDEDEQVTGHSIDFGMDNPMNAMLFSEQLIEYVLNKLGYSWPCHEGARNFPRKCVSTRFSSVIGETIIAIIDSNIEKITESYKQLIQKNIHRIDSFRIEVCVTATFFFSAGYSHVRYLMYAAQLAGLSAFYFASGNPQIAEASAQVLAYIMNYYIYQLSFYPGSDWFNLHLHALILKQQIQNGTIRFYKPQELQCNL